MQRKPLLSISILVSNRIDTIRKCMESIKPLLDGFPCELIAVDTVGEKTDGSIDVVREYTDKIYRFEWCNDFAKARNFGLEKCSGEWFMFMDDDEWFEDVSEIRDFFVSGEYKKYESANYKIHTYTDHKGSFGVGALFRMVKRNKDTRFVGRVHEYLTPLLEPAKEFSAYIHHYGYVFDTDEERFAHSERNISLLEPDFEKNPWDMHVRVQLLQEYIFMKELKDKAEKLCKETLEADSKYYKTNEFQWSLLAYVKMANKENNYEAVVERAEMIRKKYPISALADLGISTIEVVARYKLEQYKEGYAVFKHAMERRKYLLDNPDVKQRLLILDLNVFLEDSVYCEQLKYGIRCSYHLGKKERAAELVKERFAHLEIPVLSVSVLVSNRIETIRKCMESIRSLLDNIPSELIIVDTVGEENSDGSLAIAQEYSNHIISYNWDDDFAAARNAGLKEAKGEWFLYLDDDEWFESVGEIIQFFTSGESFEYNSATYIARNYKDRQCSNYSEDTVGRMVRRARNTEFIGCVNETFNNLYLPHKAFTSYVHHVGFVYDTAEEKQQHMKYVHALLEKDLEKYPKNLRNRAQLAVIYSVKNPKAAVKLCKETLENCKESKENIQYQWQAVILFGAYETLQILSEAEESYKNLIQEELLLPITEQVVCYRMTRCCIIREEYVKAYSYAKRYFDLAEVIAEAEIPKDFEKYQNKVYAEEMLPIAAFCAWQAKEYAKAWLYYECMSWETLDATAEDALWKVFAMAEECANDEVLYRMIKRIMTNGTLKVVLGKMMQSNQLVKERINKTLDSLRNEKEEKEQEIVVSISILVSNRKDTIRKCLESIKPILDAVPSELIVVDTVGEDNSDGSLAIAKEYTDKIIYFPWCNDFAAARNAGLKEAKGKWYLTLDDDEWFEDVMPIVDFFQSGDYKNYDRGWYYVRNYNNFAGSKWVDTLADRMCSITTETEYFGKVHESLLPYPSKVMQFSCYAHHYGYVFRDEEEAKKHSERNCSLLEQEVKARPEDARMAGQLVQEYAMIGRLQEGCEFCEQWLTTYKKQRIDPCAQFTAIMWLRMLTAMKKNEEALQLSDKLEKEYALREVPTLARLVEIIPVELSLQHYESVIEKVDRFFNLRKDIIKKNEETIIQQVFDLKKYLEEDMIKPMVSCGLYAVGFLGRYEKASKFLDHIDWTNKEKRPYDIMLQLTDLYGKSGMDSIFFPYAEKIIKNSAMEKQFKVALENLVRDYPEREAAIVNWLQQIKGIGSKKQMTPEMVQLVEMLKQNIQMLINEGKVAEAKELLAELKKLV